VGGGGLLTDPTFDPPGRRYSFGLGSASHKTTGPAVAIADLPPIDAVLLSHDHHGDNLDDAGRALLPSADVVLTTPPGSTGSAATPPASAPGRPPPSETAPATAHPSR
jgi:L-ascorbate metabolism protein UlaG (beta-lactamase superfamily)